MILAHSVQSEAPQTPPSHQIVSAFANTTYVNTGQTLGSSNTYAVALGRLDENASLDAFGANNNPEPNQVWLNDGVALTEVNGEAFVDAYVALVFMNPSQGQPLCWLCFIDWMVKLMGFQT